MGCEERSDQRPSVSFSLTRRHDRTASFHTISHSSSCSGSPSLCTLYQPLSRWFHNVRALVVTLAFSSKHSNGVKEIRHGGTDQCTFLKTILARRGCSGRHETGQDGTGRDGVSQSGHASIFAFARSLGHLCNANPTFCSLYSLKFSSRRMISPSTALCSTPIALRHFT